MARQIKPFRGPDNTNWGVEVQVPGASNAMIVFHHPGGKTARLDRYAWDIWTGPESRSVTSRVPPEKILERPDNPTGRAVVCFTPEAGVMCFILPPQS